LRRLRIIPARAGFTDPKMVLIAVLRDHPRSRGVYSAMIPTCRTSMGSSPLARGLPSSTADDLRSLGIIPARAGFTLPCWTRMVSLGDHPRSRGVYTVSCRPARPWSGSSPLARGLLSAHGPGCAGVGIIPARAGFT